jgi:hypothetical protein
MLIFTLYYTSNQAKIIIEILFHFSAHYPNRIIKFCRNNLFFVLLKRLTTNPIFRSQFYSNKNKFLERVQQFKLA